MHTSDYIHNQLLKAGAPARILAKPEVRHLPKIIDPNERIEAFLHGTHTSGFGFLIATDRRLLFIDKKFVDLQVDDIPYDQLSGIEYESGVVFGKVTVFAKAKNFQFRWVRKDFIAPFVRVVEHKMHNKDAKK